MLPEVLRILGMAATHICPQFSRQGTILVHRERMGNHDSRGIVRIPFWLQVISPLPSRATLTAALIIDLSDLIHSARVCVVWCPIPTVTNYAVAAPVWGSV